MSYSFYKILHYSGILVFFMATGALLYHSFLGGSKTDRARKAIVIVHGVGLFFIFLAGFGLLAKLQIHWPWPSWVWIKFLTWVALGGSLALFYRKPMWTPYIWWAIVVLGIMAAYMGHYKPII